MYRSRITRSSILVLAALSLLLGVTVMAATEQTKRQAINNGLEWLIQHQTVSGDEGYWAYDNNGTLAATGAAALAFIEEGFLPGEDVIIGIEPDTVNYGDVVGHAVNYIFNRAVFDVRFGPETGGYWHYAEDYNNDGVAGNDSLGNDQAVYFEPGETNRRLYTTGICTPVVFALGEAMGIETVIGYGSPAVNGRTYKEVMLDLVDWFCFAQVEPTQGSYRGGWRYDANYGSSDNSTAQWGSLPLLYADAWGLPTADFVYDELELWVNYIQNANGGSGYSHPGEYVNVSKTGGLLLELAAIGAGLGDSRVQNALSFINGRWNNGPSGTWYGNLNHPYAMWAVYKGLEVYELMGEFESDGHPVRYGFGMPAAPGGFEIGRTGDTRLSDSGDWYSHYSQYLVDIQNGDGGWGGYSHWTGPLATAWYINILRASAGGERPADPDIQITSTIDEPCVWYQTEVTHDIRYWFGTPGFPEPGVEPAENVVVTVTLSPHLTFLSATGDYTWDGAQTVVWSAGQMADGEERFETIVTEGASTVEPTVGLITFAAISATNVPEELWDSDRSRVTTCPTNCVEAFVGDPVFDGDALHLTVPIQLLNVAPLTPITGIDFFFNFDPTVLQVAGVTFDGTILDGLGWFHIWNEPVPGAFRLGLAGDDPIPADGVLVYLEFDIAPGAPCGGCTPLNLDMLLNEGDPCVLVTSSEDFCLPMAMATGTVNYWGCGNLGNIEPPIPGVQMTFVNQIHADTAVTDSMGVFVVDACHDSCYSLTPSKGCGETEGISPLDAALILRNFVGLEELHECPIEPMMMYDGSFCPAEAMYPQILAADVTDDGGIHAFDASMILKYIVGHDVSETKVGCWSFLCESRSLCVDQDVITGQDFVGILYGDVTGSYRLPAPLIATSSSAVLTVATVAGAPDETVEVPIGLRDADGFYSLQFQVDHDRALASIESVVPSDLASGCMVEWNAEAGHLHVAAASAQGIVGDGEFCRVVYRVHELPVGEGCILTLSDAYADEQEDCLTMVDGQITDAITGSGVAVSPEAYKLYPPIPNPFNPATSISYDVPAGGGAVQILVYDVSGRLVRTLHDGLMPAGQHSVVWHGLDDRGNNVSSGVYFVRFVAPDYKATRKLTLLK